MADTDPAVELVAQALCAARECASSAWDDPPVPSTAAEQWRDRFRAEARAAIAALLPPVVQTREERGWWNPRTQEVQRHWSYTTDGVPEGPRRVRTISTLADDGSPYGGATLTTAWRAVEGNEG